MKHLHPLFHPLLTPLCLVMIIGCSKYQVVQEVHLNLYHLHNPKRNKMEMVLTQDSLVVGKWYRLKSIKQYEINEDGDK